MKSFDMLKNKLNKKNENRKLVLYLNKSGSHSKCFEPEAKNRCTVQLSFYEPIFINRNWKGYIRHFILISVKNNGLALSTNKRTNQNREIFNNVQYRISCICCTIYNMYNIEYNKLVIN